MGCFSAVKPAYKELKLRYSGLWTVSETMLLASDPFLLPHPISSPVSLKSRHGYRNGGWRLQPSSTVVLTSEAWKSSCVAEAHRPA